MKITKENIGAQYTQFHSGKAVARVPGESPTILVSCKEKSFIQNIKIDVIEGVT